MKYLTTLFLSLTVTGSWAQTQNYSDQDVINSYHYLLGRHLIIKQETDDLKKGGMSWNKLLHRPVAETKSQS